MGKWLSLFSDNVPDILRTQAATTVATVILAMLAVGILFGPWLYRKLKAMSNISSSNDSGSNKTANKTDRERISIKDFIVEAGESGWDLESTEILDLERGVQQSALDGALVLWGRPNVHRLPQLNKYEPLLEIPKSHWKDYKPQLLDAMNVPQNIETQTNAPRFPKTDDPNRFTDLHIGWTVAKSWLTDRGLQYRGWNKLQEDERNARN